MFLWRENCKPTERPILSGTITLLTFIDLLESCRVVVHVVAAEAEEAHEGKHEVPMHPSPRVTHEERLQEVHLLRFLRHWMQQGARILCSH